MEEISENILEVLCRLSASETHPVTLGALNYFVPELPQLKGAKVDLSGLAELMKCFPERFTVDDDSELVYVNSEEALVYFFLQEQFTLARKNRLSAQFLIESCIQRFSSSSFNTAATCLNESSTFDLVDWKTVRLTSANTFNSLVYKEVTVSRFFEYLLVKLGCTKTSSWGLTILETYLLESPIAGQDINLLRLFEHHTTVFEVKTSENGTAVSLKCDTEVSSNAVIISHCKKYLSGRLAYVKELAVPLKVLCTEGISAAPMEVQRHFRRDERPNVLRKLLETHSALFEMTEDDKVYLALCPFEDQMDNLREALCYFYRLLYTLSIYGHVCICYNVLINCLHEASDSVRLFLDLEYPNLALVDFFQSMTEFFDTSFRPSCVAPVLTCKPLGRYFEDVGINELEALAVQQFASLLWIASQGLRIEILELCLDNICEEVKEYCEERYSDGLSEFFLRHPGIFSFSVETKVVRLALSLPRFSSVPHWESRRHSTEEPVIAKYGTEHRYYGDLTTLIKDVDTGNCPLAGFELFSALLGRHDDFKLLDGEVVLAPCNDLTLLLEKFDPRLDCLAKAFVGTSTSSESKLCKRATGAKVAESQSRDEPPFEPKDVSDPFSANPLPGPSSDDRDGTKSSSCNDTHLQGTAGTSLNFCLMEDALKTAPNDFQVLFRKHYPDGMAGFYRKHSYLFDQAEDGTMVLSQEYFPGGDVEDMLHLLAKPGGGAACRNEGDKEQTNDTAVESVQSPLRECSPSSTDLKMLHEIQSSAMQVKECVAELLSCSSNGRRLDTVNELLRKRKPLLLAFCEQHYHSGLLGFLRAHSSEFEILKSPNAAVCSVRLHKNAAGHSPHLVRLGGKISQLYDSSGTMYCPEYSVVLHFPAWSFLSETQTVVSNLKSVLKKGDYVISEALVNDVGRMTVLTVAKSEKKRTSGPGKATFECRVVVAGPYYSLLVPLRVCYSTGYTPALKDVTVFFSDPDTCLREGQIVRAEVRFNYPSRKLWQTLELLDTSATGDKETLPEKHAQQGQRAVSSVTPWQGSKDTLHKAIEYFARAVMKAGNDVPPNVLLKALDNAPKSVQEFCSQYFRNCPMSFVRRFTNVFKVTPDGNVRAFPQGINSQAKIVTVQTHLPKGNGAVQEVSSQSSVISEFSSCVASSVSKSAPGSLGLCNIVSPEGFSSLPGNSILRGLFGNVTGLWEAAVQVTSDHFPEPIEASPSSFVHDSGTVSVITSSEWHLGDIVEFDAIRSPSRAMPYLTCAFRVTDESAREAVMPTVCTCKVNLVTSYYVLMTPCAPQKTLPSATKRAVVILSCPEKASLTPTQEVTVEVRPGYPSSRLWKADRLLDPELH